MKVDGYMHFENQITSNYLGLFGLGLCFCLSGSFCGRRVDFLEGFSADIVPEVAGKFVASWAWILVVFVDGSASSDCELSG